MVAIIHSFFAFVLYALVELLSYMKAEEFCTRTATFVLPVCVCVFFFDAVTLAALFFGVKPPQQQQRQQQLCANYRRASKVYLRNISTTLRKLFAIFAHCNVL